MSFSYTPGEQIEVPRKRGSPLGATVLVERIQEVLVEVHLPGGVTALRRYSCFEPLDSQQGRSVAYLDLPVWDLRDIVEAGVSWQGTPRSGVPVPTPQVLYGYRRWLDHFKQFWKWQPQRRLLRQLIATTRWDTPDPAWNRGGCALAAEAIRRWIVGRGHAAGLVRLDFGEFYRGSSHVYVRLGQAWSTLLMDTRGVYTELQVRDSHTGWVRLTPLDGIEACGDLAFDEALCRELAANLDQASSCGDIGPVWRMFFEER